MVEKRPTTVVFGIDGAHFELIEPWIKEGELPNVERAISSGVSANLQSVLPPVTSPNWKAYLTGKNPGQFGIFWWENVDVDNRRIYYPQDRKQTETEFWEILAEKDRTGVINVPTTYPPKQSGEFVIAGAPDSKNRKYTHPSTLEDRLERDHDYYVTLQNKVPVSPDDAAAEIHDLIDSRFTVARELLEDKELTFLQVTTFYINTLHHFFWNSAYTREGWKIVDEHLGEILDEGYNMILMSDHGSTEIDTVFHINSWLEREEYLKLDTDAADLVYRMGINRQRILRALSTLGLMGLTRYAPQFVLDLVPNEQGELLRESKASNIYWERSDAIASGQGPIYIIADRGTERYDRIRTSLRKKLESLEGPDDRPVVDRVHYGEDIYSGPFENEAPDLVVEQANGVHIQGNVGREELFTDPAEDSWAGENKRDGMFVATGPSFETGDVAPLSILDLAPTILHLHDRDIPTDMDGEPRIDIFNPEAAPGKREPSFQEMTDREREAKRIRRVIRDKLLS